MIVAFALLGLALAASSGPPKTFRVDYFHTGNATEERFGVDRLVVEPLPWPANPRQPVDDTNLGKYFFEVRDRASNRVLYSRGFSSIYGEWELTSEAKTRFRTFHESLRFPAPNEPVQILVNTAAVSRSADHAPEPRTLRREARSADSGRRLCRLSTGQVRPRCSPADGHPVHRRAVQATQG